MESMARARGGSQARPDHGRGVVVAIDISKGRLDYGVYRAERGSKVKRLVQNRGG